MNRNAVSVIRIGLISILGLIIVVYSGFQAEKVVRGPIIEVFSPENGSTYNQTLIEIEGRARNIAYIEINDRPMFTDKNGYFKEKLLLSPGYNIIKLDAQDKFKQYTEKRLELVLKEY
jgi:Glucodextranase, domain B